MSKIPEPVASSLDEAWQPVKDFVDKLADSQNAQVKKFYQCEPSTAQVCSFDRKDNWTEGMWGSLMSSTSFDVDDLIYQARQLGDDKISVSGMFIRPDPDNPYRIVLSLGISARIPDEEPEGEDDEI